MDEKPMEPSGQAAHAAPLQSTRSWNELGGPLSKDWDALIVNTVIMALPQYRKQDNTSQDLLPIVFEGLHGIAPKDVIEEMLAAQMLACHHAAMDCYSRAHQPGQSLEVRTEALRMAAKLSRTYAMLAEALNRHRGKGQQKVTIEHVHVHEGGQAIVGNVAHRGGGSKRKRRE